MRTVKRFANVAAACGLATVAAFGLAGCSGAHEIIDSGKQCTSCHADKQTYDVASPLSAIQTGTNVTVQTSASCIEVCSVTFISEDGSKFVPERCRTVSVDGGSATIELSDGTWALCVANGNSVSKSVLVCVDSGLQAETSVSL